MAKKSRSRLPVVAAVVVMGGVAAWALVPSIKAMHNALPLLRHANVVWVAGAALCQCAMYAALAGVLWAGLSASEGKNSENNENEPSPPHLGFFFLWATGTAFLWASRALPGPALAGIATLTFLLNRRKVSTAASQAVAATFFLADYVSFFGLGLLLFAALAFQNRLTHLHPGLLAVGMALIVGGFAAFALVIRAPEGAGRTAEKSGLLAARLLRRSEETRKNWGEKAKNGVQNFYERWQNITARRRTLAIATAWACAMHLAEAATVFCAAHAFGAGPENMARLMEASGAGYVTGNLAAIVSFLPAGLGFFEGAMGTTLHYIGGVSVGQATLATLLYRVLSVWLPLPFVVGVARQAIHAAHQHDET